MKQYLVSFPYSDQTLYITEVNARTAASRGAIRAYHLSMVGENIVDPISVYVELNRRSALYHVQLENDNNQIRVKDVYLMEF